MKRLRKSGGLMVLAVALSWYSGCRTGARTVPPHAPAAPPAAAADEIHGQPAASAQPSETLARMGYTIQVGAFAVLDNARALAEALTAAGLDAFYFPTGSGLFKVRFGNFPSWDAAVVEAGSSRKKGASLNISSSAPRTMQ